MSDQRAQSLDDRIDAIEAGYEFMLAYAAQGRATDQGAGGAASEIRDFLVAMERALDGLGEAVSARLASGNTAAAEGAAAFLVAVHEDAARAQALVRLVLAKEGIKASMSGRAKRPYSIWRKMQRDRVGFEQLADIMAFRVVVDSIGDCYQALGVIHSAYPVVPGRFKDYLSVAKPNGYRSIHTGVFGPERQRIEIQIRTHEMHDVAEHGVAAHWQYKQGVSKDGKQYRWLRELLDILEHASEPEEFLEHTKLAMFRDQVFCFTPKGDLINLPRGSTPVDFAYAIHSEVGDHCSGAKINGRMIPLHSKLRNGDQVEIVTSKSQTPSPAWERFAVTGKARARIRRYVHNKEREQYIDLGRAILQKAFRREGARFSEKPLKGIVEKFGLQTVEDLYASVGQGNQTEGDIMRVLFPDSQRDDKETGKVVPLAKARGRRRRADEKNAVPLKGLIPGMAFHFARCCHPLPGDRIVGIVTTGKGVTIHTGECDTLKNYADSPGRWLDVSWGGYGSVNHVARITVVLANAPGSLGDLSTLIGKGQGNITNLRFTNRSEDFFETMIDIEVQDTKHLTNIIAALRASPFINSVERARG